MIRHGNDRKRSRVVNDVMPNVIISDYRVDSDYPVMWQLGLCDLEDIGRHCIRVPCIDVRFELF